MSIQCTEAGVRAIPAGLGQKGSLCAELGQDREYRQDLNPVNSPFSWAINSFSRLCGRRTPNSRARAAKVPSSSALAPSETAYPQVSDPEARLSCHPSETALLSRATAERVSPGLGEWNRIGLYIQLEIAGAPHCTRRVSAGRNARLQ